MMPIIALNYVYIISIISRQVWCVSPWRNKYKVKYLLSFEVEVKIVLKCMLFLKAVALIYFYEYHHCNEAEMVRGF